MRNNHWGIIFLTASGIGCSATYTDLGARADGISSPQSTVFDAGFLDGGEAAGLVVYRGTWTERAGHPASGTVEVVEHSTGTELRFLEDFVSSGVPGPVVVLSNRESIGSSIDVNAGDLEIGKLQSPRGAQSYLLTSPTDEYAYIWIFCKPFGVEVARATLEEVSK